MTRRTSPFDLVAQKIRAEAKGCAPVRLGMDEYRCLTCGRVWDTHEDKPECERDKP